MDQFNVPLSFKMTRHQEEVHLHPQTTRRPDETVRKRDSGIEAPGAIRQALIEYFNKLDEQQLRRARLRFLEEKGITPQR